MQGAPGDQASSYVDLHRKPAFKPTSLQNYFWVVSGISGLLLLLPPGINSGTTTVSGTFFTVLKCRIHISEMHTCIKAHTHTHIYIYIYIYYMCMYIYIYDTIILTLYSIYAYTHTHIQATTDIQIHRNRYRYRNQYGCVYINTVYTCIPTSSRMRGLKLATRPSHYVGIYRLLAEIPS